MNVNDGFIWFCHKTGWFHVLFKWIKVDISAAKIANIGLPEVRGNLQQKKTMLFAGWLKRGWDVPWVSESHQIQDAMNKNARRNLEIRWLVIVAVFFNHRIAGFWCFQHMCSKKHPGQLELQMGDWYWPGAKFQVIPCLRSNILNILPSGYLTEPLEINIFV